MPICAVVGFDVPCSTIHDTECVHSSVCGDFRDDRHDQSLSRIAVACLHVTATLMAVAAYQSQPVEAQSGGGCCTNPVDCPFESKLCTSPCDAFLDVDPVWDPMCPKNYCCSGVCFVKERISPQGACEWNCANGNYAQCDTEDACVDG